MTSPPVPGTGRRLVSTAAVVAAAAIFGLTYGLAAPLIAVEMAERGAVEWLIGLNAAMHAVGVLLIAPVLPRLAVRFGAHALMIVALAASAALLALFPLAPSVWLWFPLRLALGAAAEVLFVLSETWTNDLSDERTRGRTMAVYTAFLSLGFAGGPAILAWIGTDARAFLVGALIAALAIVPLVNPWIVRPRRMEPSTTRPWTYARLAPVALATTLLNAAVETAGLSFIVLYATGLGWPEARGMQLVSTLMVGAIVLQLPIGWLADKMDPRRLVLALAVLSTLGALAWPFTFATPWLAFAVVFVWGGLFVGIYTVMLAIVGSRFSGGDLVGIYAVMGLAWGAGALVGPSIAGGAMSVSAAYGLPFAIAAGCAVFAVFMSMRKGTS